MEIKNAVANLAEVLSDIIDLFSNHKTITALGLTGIGPDDVAKAEIVKTKMKGLLK